MSHKEDRMSETNLVFTVLNMHFLGEKFEFGLESTRTCSWSSADNEITKLFQQAYHPKGSTCLMYSGLCFYQNVFSFSSTFLLLQLSQLVDEVHHSQSILMKVRDSSKREVIFNKCLMYMLFS